MEYLTKRVKFLKQASKVVKKTDKSKNAYVLISEQVAVLQAAGLTLSAAKPEPIVNVIVVGEEIRQVIASYYFAVRKGSGRAPEPRMGREFISQWLNVGDDVTLATDGRNLYAFRNQQIDGIDEDDVYGGREKSQSKQVRETQLGVRYRRANENATVGNINLIKVEPAVVERGVRGHAVTQNALADYLDEHDLIPLSPSIGDPDFDLAWEVDGTIFVAEIKSVTKSNEESQLRLGLGQVLQYRHQLKQLYNKDVIAILAMEQEAPEEWVDVCASAGVRIVWPGNYDALQD
jgi:hypothetical protein